MASKVLLIELQILHRRLGQLARSHDDAELDVFGWRRHRCDWQRYSSSPSESSDATLRYSTSIWKSCHAVGSCMHVSGGTYNAPPVQRELRLPKNCEWLIRFSDRMIFADVGTRLREPQSILLCRRAKLWGTNPYHLFILSNPRSSSTRAIRTDTLAWYKRISRLSLADHKVPSWIATEAKGL